MEEEPQWRPCRRLQSSIQGGLPCCPSFTADPAWVGESRDSGLGVLCRDDKGLHLTIWDFYLRVNMTMTI